MHVFGRRSQLMETRPLRPSPQLSLNMSLEGILITYHCVINYSKTNWFKVTYYYLLWFCKLTGLSLAILAWHLSCSPVKMLLGLPSSEVSNGLDVQDGYLTHRSGASFPN